MPHAILAEEELELNLMCPQVACLYIYSRFHSHCNYISKAIHSTDHEHLQLLYVLLIAAWCKQLIISTIPSVKFKNLREVA